ncbi:MAG TPA: hypothetical protein VH184_18260 [Dongiaceae bacterium]|jgi:hypothetical protein|nr:hypothetical protein [Dongiaceae bacterium]
MDRINPAEPRRIVLQRQLALVLRNIETGVQRIAVQHEVIAKLGASGHDTSEAVRELANFERLHELNIATHRNVMRELTALAEVPRLTRTARLTA